MTTDDALAARYFADNELAGLQRNGVPEETIRQLASRHIRDTVVNPEAMSQLRDMYPHSDTACVTCGNTAAENLKWVGDDALCRSLADCKERMRRRSWPTRLTRGR